MADSQGQVGEILAALPRCIHLAGVDGTGKTTQGKALLGFIRDQGIEVGYAWLRFPRFFTVPFLIYARLRGFSHREVVDGNEHGYWNFEESWVMSRIFPWVLWLDAFLLALFKVYVPLWRDGMIMCDRFVVDTLVDLMVGLKEPRFDERLPGRLFLSLLPRGTCVVVLDLETSIAQQRSPELVGDRTHAQRRQTYLDVAGRQGFSIISTDSPVAEITLQMLNVITGSGKLDPDERQTLLSELLAGKDLETGTQANYSNVAGDN